MSIVEQYYGAEIFYEDAFNELVPEIYDLSLIHIFKVVYRRD